MTRAASSLMAIALCSAAVCVAGPARCAAATVFWAGGQSGTWSVGGTGWTTDSAGTSPTTWSDGNVAEFYKTAGTATISGTVSPTQIYNDSNNAVTISGGSITLGTAGEPASTLTLQSDQGGSNTTVTSSITLAGNQTWRSGSNGATQINGNVDGGGNALTISNTTPYSGKSLSLSGNVTNLSSLSLDATTGQTLTITGSGSVNVGSGVVSNDNTTKGSFVFDNASALDSGATLSLVQSTDGTNEAAALDYTGNMYLSSLVLGGTAQGPGTYNATTDASYFNGTGNIVIAVPEPATLAVGGVGLSLLLLLRRRRRTSAA